MYPTTFSYIRTPLPHTYIFHSRLTTTSYGFEILFHALQHMECQRVGDNALWLITIVTAVQREATGGNEQTVKKQQQQDETQVEATGGNEQTIKKQQKQEETQREATGGNGRQREATSKQ